MYSLSGAILGGLILVILRQRPDIQVIMAIAPYIAGIAAGAIVGAVLITYRSPLDLLQVRE